MNHLEPELRSRQRRRPQEPGLWHAARPELVVVSVAVAACAVAAYAVAGGPAAVTVVVVFSAVALGVLSVLLPSGEGAPATPETPGNRASPTASFINYWRMRRGLSDAMSSTAAYRAGLGPNLEHVLAARLSEHHGVSLYGQPEVARSILCANARDGDLWRWVDPTRPPGGDLDGPGIPPRTLARLVQRLEQL
ncbi:MAG TPA: hypothetical protein VMF65_12050 [Acidimicrobiales bacterium]|nr:hypothetical protein [Acidimicrobiales bacterium]